VRIAGADRAGLERLLRYCARPPFALEHLRQLDAEHLVYHSPKQGMDGAGDLVIRRQRTEDRGQNLVYFAKLLNKNREIAVQHSVFC
jgi:hypothetical protein